MNPQRCSTLTGLVALLAGLQGCVFVPRTTQVYDAACQTVTRHMVLQEVQVAAIQGCQNEGCVALIVMAGAVGAASAVVSGTIVITGNIAYWLEKQAQCRPAAAPAGPALTGPSLPSGG